MMREPTLQTPVARYTRTAAALHWLLGAAITANFALGAYMHELPLTPTRLELFNFHKWAGITILALSALRLLWRLAHAPPPPLPMPALQLRLAQAVHAALYLLFFAVPLAGWAYSSAAGFPVVVFGMLPLPDFVAPDRALAETLKGLHQTLALLLGALVVGHVAAALKHHWLDRDGLLARMRIGSA
jgi:cytochrome b561